MDGGAFEGGMSFKKMLGPGDSVWDEIGKFKLKKCPFCGEYPDWTFTDGDEDGLQWMIHCQERTCHVKPWTSWSDQPEFASLKWNRRFAGGKPSGGKWMK